MLTVAWNGTISSTNIKMRKHHTQVCMLHYTSAKLLFFVVWRIDTRHC